MKAGATLQVYAPASRFVVGAGLPATYGANLAPLGGELCQLGTFPRELCQCGTLPRPNLTTYTLNLPTVSRRFPPYLPGPGLTRRPAGWTRSSPSPTPRPPQWTRRPPRKSRPRCRPVCGLPRTPRRTPCRTRPPERPRWSRSGQAGWSDSSICPLIGPNLSVPVDIEIARAICRDAAEPSLMRVGTWSLSLPHSTQAAS